jgi:hypothetical protein
MILFFFFRKIIKMVFFLYFYDAWGRPPPENWSRNFPFFFVVVSYQRQNPKPTGRTLDIKLQIALCVCVFYHCLLSSRYL